MKAIQTDKAPTAIGPYSQAIESNGFVFCSGQIGIDPENGSLVDGVENQTRQVINNLAAVLAAVEVELSGIVKTTIYLKNMADFAKVNEIYGEYFPAHKPARVTVGVSELPKGALVEIEAVAVKK